MCAMVWMWSCECSDVGVVICCVVLWLLWYECGVDMVVWVWWCGCGDVGVVMCGVWYVCGDVRVVVCCVIF